jgi:hypothetical protein
VIALRAIGLAGAAGLCLLGAEWRYLATPVTVPAAVPALRTAAVPDRPVPPPPPADPDELVRTILQRPLFSRTRQPATIADGPAAGNGPALPRLSGVILLPGLRRAFFQPSSAAKQVVIVVAEAGRIDSWKVESIDSDGVKLTRAGETILLAPAFASAVAEKSPAPPPRRLSLWEAPAEEGILRDRWSNPQLQP